MDLGSKYLCSATLYMGAVCLLQFLTGIGDRTCEVALPAQAPESCAVLSLYLCRD